MATTLHETILDVETDAGVMGVIAKRPAYGSTFPVVLLHHDGPGVREATHQVARIFAEAGFYTFAPDRYYRFGPFKHVPPEDLIAAGHGSELMERFFEMVTATTDDMVRSDMTRLIMKVRKDSYAQKSRFKAIGYCNGVRYMLQSMWDQRDDFDAGVGLHPSFCIDEAGSSPHLLVSKLQSQLYFAFGEDDHLASVQDNAALLEEIERAAMATFDILRKADHGFAMPGPSFNADAARHAHSKAIELFGQLRSDTQSEA